MARDAQGLFERRIGVHVVDNSLLRNVFDQPRAKRRRRDAEDDIVQLFHLVEVLLREGTGLRLACDPHHIGCVRATLEGKKIVNTTIGRVADGAVGIENEREPGFTHRPGRADEKGDCVGAAIIGGSLNLGVGAYEGELVLPRTGSARGRLGVATATTQRVKRWAQPVRDSVDLQKRRLTVTEELSLVRGQRAKGLTGINRVGPHTRVVRARTGCGLRLNQRDHGERQKRKNGSGHHHVDFVRGSLPQGVTHFRLAGHGASFPFLGSVEPV